MQTKKIFTLSNLFLVTLLIVAFVLRFVHLGYSDFQGDEIKALFPYNDFSQNTEYLFDQRKGPVQFIVTYLLKAVSSNYTNYFIVRFPFATASFLAVPLFYLFLNRFFSKRISFFATFFFAVNGFVVAFGRIVQYQSFVIFFMMLALYLMSRAYTNTSKKSVLLVLGSFLAWGLSILSHYDGVFIFPVMGFLFFSWLFKLNFSNKVKFGIFVITGIAFIAPLLAFYIPFVMSLSSDTLAYWQNRITGGSGKISSSINLFRVYQPIYAIHIYYILSGLGLFAALTNKINLKTKQLKSHFLHWKSEVLIYIPFALWALIPFLFMELFINIPGTHIFTYLIPVTLFISLGIDYIIVLLETSLVDWIGKILAGIGIVIVLGFLFLQSFVIFVDHTFEYPWEAKKLLIWTLHMPSANYHLSLFGFPYYRRWQDISKIVNSNPEISAYSCNERDSIVRYYVDLDKGADQAGYYIYINNPQSFNARDLGEKGTYWTQKNSPSEILFYKDKEVARIYTMPVGSLEAIKLQGY